MRYLVHNAQPTALYDSCCLTSQKLLNFPQRRQLYCAVLNIKEKIQRAEIQQALSSAIEGLVTVEEIGRWRRIIRYNSEKRKRVKRAGATSFQFYDFD